MPPSEDANTQPWLRASCLSMQDQLLSPQNLQRIKSQITEPLYARSFLKFKLKKNIKSTRHKRQGGKPKGNLSKQSITENKLSTTVLEGRWILKLLIQYIKKSLWSLLVCFLAQWLKIPMQTNFGRKQWLLHGDHSPWLREVRAETWKQERK